MAINISAWSIRHPLPAMVMFAAIVALGFLSFSRLPITDDRSGVAPLTRC